jgi:DNA-binding MarR family transcriptional regulator
MESCQENMMQEKEKISLTASIMDWTAVFVRLWMHDIIRFTRATGLSFGQMNLMLHIHYRGSCEVSGVSNLLGVTPAGASQMVERMVQQGLVKRSEVPGDRRVRRVDLTEEGNRMALDCIHVHEKWVAELAESLEPGQREAAVQLIDLLVENATKIQID